MTTLRPLSGQELRALYAAKPSPQLAAALWEIKRLHAVIVAAWRNLDRGATAKHPAAQTGCYFGALAMGDEPCIRAILVRDWAQRDIEGTRYYDERDKPCRPSYNPCGDQSPKPGSLPCPPQIGAQQAQAASQRRVHRHEAATAAAASIAAASIDMHGTPAFPGWCGAD